ncbi:MAG: hypothetical protein AB1553_14825 [Nitrospirota bacterium]
MKKMQWTILVLCLFGSTVCFADSVVITFKSGKTQEIVLEDRAEAVEGIQFRSGQKDAAQAAPKQGEEIAPKADKEGKSEKKRSAKASKEKNEGIRFKWAEPRTGE